MKKMLMLLAALLLCVLLLTACAKKDAGPAAEIKGEWTVTNIKGLEAEWKQLKDAGSVMVYVFDDNTKGQLSIITATGEESKTLDQAFVVEGGNITIGDETSKLSINGSTMTITYETFAVVLEKNTVPEAK